ncbi:MAG: DUF305 domain-containing protein [Pleurocapsa sp. SU_196_0]|nr:DUF305 domain-containing protein [Pleurocapsa sp. SU_196_0]
MKKILFTLGSSLLLSVAGAQMNHDMGSTSMKALEAASGKTFDVYWMSQMIEHHRGAVTMAQGVLKNGKNKDVKAAAMSIVKNQSNEIKQLEGWLKAWYDAKPDAKQMALMKADMKPMMDGASGGMAGMSMGDADKNFLEAMIPHHQSAIDMSQLALKKALKPELKTFARKVIKDQSAEIKQYKAWLSKM